MHPVAILFATVLLTACAVTERPAEPGSGTPYTLPWGAVTLDAPDSAEEARQILEENLEDIGSLEMLSEHLLHLAQYQRGRRVLDFEKIGVGQMP